MKVIVDFNLNIEKFVVENWKKKISSKELFEIVEDFYNFVSLDCRRKESENFRGKKEISFLEIIQLYLEEKFIGEKLGNFLKLNYDENNILTEINKEE